MEKIVHFLKDMTFRFVKAVVGKWRYFLLLSEKRGRAIRDAYYFDSELENAFRGCIFMSNGMTPMGGLCDRLKGIVTTYAWCKDHDMPFKIQFVSPFDLERYLVPASYDWKVGPGQISYSKNDSTVLCLLYTFDIADIVDGGLALEKTKVYFDKRLPEGRSRQIHIYTNAQTMQADESFSTLFAELFKPSVALQGLLAFYKQQIGGDYISISFRFTTLLGDLNDCTGEPLSGNEAEEYISVCLGAIDRISSERAQGKKVLVTADSSTFLSRVTNPACYVIPGKIGHVQYDSDDEVNMKTFLDLMMISDADEVYLVKYKKMYNSGFARTAAKINSKPYTVYEPAWIEAYGN